MMKKRTVGNDLSSWLPWRRRAAAEHMRRADAESEHRLRISMYLMGLRDALRLAEADGLDAVRQEGRRIEGEGYSVGGPWGQSAFE